MAFSLHQRILKEQAVTELCDILVSYINIILLDFPLKNNMQWNILF